MLATVFKAFNKKYTAELATIPEYAAEEETFNDAMAIIDSAAQVQTATVGASADASEMAKQVMANTVIKYALRAAVKARQAGNLVLATNLDHPLTYLSKASKTEAVHRAKDIRDNLNNNLPTLTNITAADISEVDGVIATYENIKDTPTIDKQTKAASGTNPLPAAFAMAFQSMDNMYDLVISYFGDTAPAMVDEAGLAKQIIITGVHHNGIDGVVTKAGQPLTGATIAINDTSKIATSDVNGRYFIDRMKNGSHTITASHPSASLQTKATTITKAHVETVDFEL